MLSLSSAKLLCLQHFWYQNVGVSYQLSMRDFWCLPPGVNSSAGGLTVQSVRLPHFVDKCKSLVCWTSDLTLVKQGFLQPTPWLDKLLGWLSHTWNPVSVTVTRSLWRKKEHKWSSEGRVPNYPKPKLLSYWGVHPSSWHKMMFTNHKLPCNSSFIGSYWGSRRWEETIGYCQIAQSLPSVVSRGLSVAHRFLHSIHMVVPLATNPYPRTI